MKIFIVILLTTTCCAQVISASGYDKIDAYDSLRIGEAPHPAPPPPPPSYDDANRIGHISQFRSDYNDGKFKFGYDELHASGGSSRIEEGLEDGGRLGSYSLAELDGRRRKVDYLADHTGFHAIIRSNEPGVEPMNPADVYIHKEPDYAPYRHHDPNGGASARQGYESSQGTVGLGHGTAPAAVGQEARDIVYPAPSDIRYSVRSTNQMPSQYRTVYPATFASNNQYHEDNNSPNYLQQDSPLPHPISCKQFKTAYALTHPSNIQ